MCEHINYIALITKWWSLSELGGLFIIKLATDSLKSQEWNHEATLILQVQKTRTLTLMKE